MPPNSLGAHAAAHDDSARSSVACATGHCSPCCVLTAPGDASRGVEYCKIRAVGGQLACQPLGRAPNPGVLPPTRIGGSGGAAPERLLAPPRLEARQDPPRSRVSGSGRQGLELRWRQPSTVPSSPPPRLPGLQATPSAPKGLASAVRGGIQAKRGGGEGELGSSRAMGGAVWGRSRGASEALWSKLCFASWTEPRRCNSRRLTRFIWQSRTSLSQFSVSI